MLQTQKPAHTINSLVTINALILNWFAMPFLTVMTIPMRMIVDKTKVGIYDYSNKSIFDRGWEMHLV